MYAAAAGVGLVGQSTGAAASDSLLASEGTAAASLPGASSHEKAAGVGLVGQRSGAAASDSSSLPGAAMDAPTILIAALHAPATLVGALLAASCFGPFVAKSFD